MTNALRVFDEMPWLTETPLVQNEVNHIMNEGVRDTTWVNVVNRNTNLTSQSMSLSFIAPEVRKAIIMAKLQLNKVHNAR